MLGENPSNHVLVDWDVERQGQLLCDSRTAPVGITLLHFDDRMDEFCTRSFRAALPTAIRGEQHAVLLLAQSFKARAARGASPAEIEEVRTLYARSGRKGVVKWDLNKALQRWGKDHWHNEAFIIAQLYADLGDMDNSFRWIDRCIELRSTVLIWVYIGDTAWRNDPRFAEVQRKMGVHY